MSRRYEFPCVRLPDGAHIHATTFLDVGGAMSVMCEIVDVDGSSERFVSTIPDSAADDTGMVAKLCFSFGFRCAQSEGHDLNGNVSIAIDPEDPLHQLADEALKAVQSLPDTIEIYRPATATVH